MKLKRRYRDNRSELSRKSLVERRELTEKCLSYRRKLPRRSLDDRWELTRKPLVNRLKISRKYLDYKWKFLDDIWGAIREVLRWQMRQEIIKELPR